MLYTCLNLQLPLICHNKSLPYSNTHLLASWACAESHPTAAALLHTPATLAPEQETSAGRQDRQAAMCRSHQPSISIHTGDNMKTTLSRGTATGAARSACVLMNNSTVSSRPSSSFASLTHPLTHISCLTHPPTVSDSLSQTHSLILTQAHSSALTPIHPIALPSPTTGVNPEP